MLKAYYASRISDNKAETPEGYSIRLNVPIARTGWLEYMPAELGIEGNLPVQLYRSEKEVFSAAAIASFEGKPVTNEHPLEWLSPTNVNAYMKGVATNVRRGEGLESELLLADLIIYDPVLMSEIESGKRDVSAGYEYTCVPFEGEGEGEGKYLQKNIRCNHIAIVRAGRAGKQVSVKDEKPNQERGKKMAKISKDTIFGKMFKAFAADAEPEELAEASKLMNNEGKDQEPPVVNPVPPTSSGKDQEPHSEIEEEKFFSKLVAVIEELKTDISGLKSDIAELKATKPQESTDALEELEKELESTNPTPATNDAAVVIDPQKLEDNAVVTDPQERPKNPIPGADSRAALRMAINAVKPIVAAIPNPGQRKTASDSMAKVFREQLQIAPKAINPYAAMAHPAKPAQAQDKKPDASELGEYLKKKYNPHFKEAK